MSSKSNYDRDSAVTTMKPFTVRAEAVQTRIRKRPYKDAEPREEILPPGRYTIVEVSDAEGSRNGWGLLKDYEKTRDGWVNLDVVVRV